MTDNIDEIIQLTEDQEKAIHALERSFKKCRESNVSLVLTEDMITAYNGNVIEIDAPLSEIITDYPYNEYRGQIINSSGYRLDGRFDLNNDYVQVKEERSNSFDVSVHRA